MASQLAQWVKNPPAMQEAHVQSLGQEDPRRSPEGRHGSPPEYSCLEGLMDNKNLVGYSPWGQKELDMPEATEHAHTLTY